MSIIGYLYLDRARDRLIVIISKEPLWLYCSQLSVKSPDLGDITHCLSRASALEIFYWWFQRTSAEDLNRGPGIGILHRAYQRTKRFYQERLRYCIRVYPYQYPYPPLFLSKSAEKDKLQSTQTILCLFIFWYASIYCWAFEYTAEYVDTVHGYGDSHVMWITRHCWVYKKGHARVVNEWHRLIHVYSISWKILVWWLKHTLSWERLEFYYFRIPNLWNCSTCKG